MKKLVILTAVLILNFNVKAYNDPYTIAMAKGMEMLATAQNPEDYLAVANQFERIAKAETEKWQPSYYASFAMIILSANQSDPARIDQYLEVAQRFLDQAMAIKNDNAEILALQGFLYMVAIGVDPATRGQQYSALSAAALQKAQALDAENPRVLHLLARLSYGTAMFFGSDTSMACQMNDIAVKRFEATAANHSADPFAPNWGKEMAIGFKNECSN